MSDTTNDEKPTRTYRQLAAERDARADAELRAVIWRVTELLSGQITGTYIAIAALGRATAIDVSDLGLATKLESTAARLLEVETRGAERLAAIIEKCSETRRALAPLIDMERGLGPIDRAKLALDFFDDVEGRQR